MHGQNVTLDHYTTLFKGIHRKTTYVPTTIEYFHASTNVISENSPISFYKVTVFIA